MDLQLEGKTVPLTGQLPYQVAKSLVFTKKATGLHTDSVSPRMKLDFGTEWFPLHAARLRFQVYCPASLNCPIML
jgi:hypothetical protein